MVLGSWNPNSPYVLFGPKLAFSSSQNTTFKREMANFEAKNAVKQGKNAKRTNGTHFTRVQPPPISGKTLSEWKGRSRRAPGYTRSSSRKSESHSRNATFQSRNVISRLEQYESHSSREQLPERFPGMMGTHMTRFSFALHSRSFFFENLGAPRAPEIQIPDRLLMGISVPQTNVLLRLTTDTLWAPVPPHHLLLGFPPPPLCSIKTEFRPPALTPPPFRPPQTERNNNYAGSGLPQGHF